MEIALDLVALWREGVIGSADDPEAFFYAVLLHLFDGQYAGKAPAAEENSPGSAESR
jgi:hypothetical protein